MGHVWVWAVVMAASTAMDATNGKDSAYLAEVRGELPNAGQHLLGDMPDVEQFEFTYARHKVGTVTRVAVEDAGKSRAVRVDVRERTKNKWDIQVRSPGSEIAIDSTNLAAISTATFVFFHCPTVPGSWFWLLRSCESE